MVWQLQRLTSFLHTRNSFFIDIDVKILITSVQEGVVTDEITVRLSESPLISQNLKMALRENRNLLLTAEFKFKPV